MADLKSTELEEIVQTAYSAIADDPEGDHPFPVGRKLALNLGYPAQLLDTLPKQAVEAFSGVTNVSLQAGPISGKLVLDLGCGAGTDTLIALSRGASVIALDFSPTMLERTREAAAELGLTERLKLIRAQAHELPLEDESVDLVMVNGIFNLNPRRAEIQREIFRVLRFGGRVVVGELVRRPGARVVSPERDNWVA